MCSLWIQLNLTKLATRDLFLARCTYSQCLGKKLLAPLTYGCMCNVFILNAATFVEPSHDSWHDAPILAEFAKETIYSRV